jgi:hypothetical protein
LAIGNSDMIYYLLYELVYYHFREKDWYLVKALNVFQYVTFRTAYATITALLISLFFGGKLIEALRKWNIGQQIREEGPRGPSGKTRNADDGWCADRRFGPDLDVVMGQALEHLRVDRHVATLLFAAVGLSTITRRWRSSAVSG